MEENATSTDKERKSNQNTKEKGKNKILGNNRKWGKKIIYE